MHNLKNFFFALVVCTGFFVGEDLIAMQNTVSSENASYNKSNRQEVVLHAVELISANARIFEIAYQLAMNAARALRDEASKPVSTKPSAKLISEAKQWMGSAVDFGKDHGWPKGIYDNQHFIALHFLRAAGYWLTYYIDMNMYAKLLKNNPGDNSIIKFVFDELKEHKEKQAPPGKHIGQPEGRYEPQQQHEIDEAGNYPAIDYEGLMYGPWADIMGTLESLYSEKAPYYSFGNKIRGPLRERIKKNDLQLQEASYFFVGYQDIKNMTYDSKISYGKKFDAPARLVKNKPEHLREPFVNDKLIPPLADLEDIIKSLDESLNLSRYFPEKPTNTAQLQPQRKIKIENKSTCPEKILVEAKVELATQEIANAKAPAPPVKTKTPLNKKPHEAHASDNLSAEKVDKKPSNQNEQSLNSRFIYTPFLSQEVVEKFLDIFGNEKGQLKGKQKKLYKTQGWGSIKDLKDTLTKADWLINQREINGELQREKHASSTISFRMPHSGRSVTAPMLKFHNDHTIGEQMREITRHFIVKSLEHFGYTEEFLLMYYKYNFVAN